MKTRYSFEPKLVKENFYNTVLTDLSKFVSRLSLPIGWSKTPKTFWKYEIKWGKNLISENVASYANYAFLVYAFEKAKTCWHAPLQEDRKIHTDVTDLQFWYFMHHVWHIEEQYENFLESWMRKLHNEISEIWGKPTFPQISWISKVELWYVLKCQSLCLWSYIFMNEIIFIKIKWNSKVFIHEGRMCQNSSWRKETLKRKWNIEQFNNLLKLCMIIQ